jgi:hypothetical protein
MNKPLFFFDDVGAICAFCDGASVVCVLLPPNKFILTDIFSFVCVKKKQLQNPKGHVFCYAESHFSVFLFDTNKGIEFFKTGNN